MNYSIRLQPRMPLSSDPTQALPVLNEKLETLTAHLQDLLSQLTTELFAAPAKPYEWMLAVADGMHWDPGQGRGLYQYINGTWQAAAVDNSTVLVDPWHLLTAEASWVNYGNNAPPLAYKKQDRDVLLQGKLKSGTFTDGTTVFNLPTGYRPQREQTLPFVGYTGAALFLAYFLIDSAGNAKIYSAIGSDWIVLNGLRFNLDM